MRFTIGADPELFMIASTGKYVSSIGKIGGTKEHPQDVGMGCAVQEDNVAVEFNIPPAGSLIEFQSSLDYAMKLLEKRVGKLGLTLAVTASAEFDADQLAAPAAKVFGCDPDSNAWTLQQNPRPIATNKSLRSCGGHVHVGTDLNGIDVIRAMDLFLGVPSTVLDPDTRRRELYGKAGAYRIKPYGVEYRTLSNFWLKSPDLIKWVYESTEHALKWVKERTYSGLMDWDKKDSGAIQACINNNNKDAFMYLNEKYALGL